MIKRYSVQLTEGKISRFFSQAKYSKNKVCKGCKSRVLYKLKDGRYECSRCHFRFSLKTNTYLKHSRAALDVWYELLWWFVYGFTANKTAKETEVSQKLVHRCFIIIRKALYEYEEENIKPVFGTVEIDETYVGPKFKNRRMKNREYYRKVGAVKRGRGAKTMLQPVFGFYQRNGTVYVEFVCDAKKKTLQDIIKGKIVLQSNIYTDTWKSYKGLNKKGYYYQTIDHGKQEYVKEKKGKKVHINGIEGFWGYLKEQLLKHHGVSKTNLIYYVKEQEFRFNNRHLSTDDFVSKIINILMNFASPDV
jgi:transposase-like protein/ribosomal protein L37AE/L43A